MQLIEAYSLLGCTPNSTEDELKKSYRALAMKWHPDVYQGTDCQSALRMTQLLNEARQLIEDSKKASNISFFWTCTTAEDVVQETQTTATDETAPKNNESRYWDYAQELYWDFARKADEQIPWNHFFCFDERDKFLNLLKGCFREEFFRLNRTLYSKIEEHLKFCKDKLNFVTINVSYTGKDYSPRSTSATHLPQTFLGKKVVFKQQFCSTLYSVYTQAGDYIATIGTPLTTKAYASSVVRTAIQHGMLKYERATIASLAPFAIDFSFTFYPKRKINYDVIRAQLTNLEPTYQKMYNLWTNHRNANVADIQRITSAKNPFDLFELLPNQDINNGTPFAEYVFGTRRKSELRFLRFSADDSLLSAVIKEIHFLNLINEYLQTRFWIDSAPSDSYWLKNTSQLLTSIINVKIKRYKTKSATPTVTVSVKIILHS